MILGKKISQHIFPASVGQSIIKGHNINNTDLKPALFQIFPHLKFRSRDFTNGRNKDKGFFGILVIVGILMSQKTKEITPFQ